jgi:hypothetical protein
MGSLSADDVGGITLQLSKQKSSELLSAMMVQIGYYFLS